jgi:uncharacterized protein
MDAREVDMLIELYGQNFGCFRDEFRLSMLATDIDPASDRGIVEVQVEGDPNPLRLLRAVAILGPNGSGKSTVLRAAGALRQLISEARTQKLRSDSLLRPYEPFALSEQIGAPVRLGLKAVIDGRIYDYEIQFDKTKFLSERLLWLQAERNTLFHGNGQIVLFHRKAQVVEGEWTKNERFELLIKDFRPNSLLLSLADRLTPALAKNIAVGIRRLLTPFHHVLDQFAPPWLSEHSKAAKLARDDPQFGIWFRKQLQSADIGVVDFHAKESKARVMVSPDEVETETFYQLTLLHRGTNGAVPIPYNRESHGTQKLVEFAPMFFDLVNALKSRAIFVDEIDESLHSTLLQGILRHFNCDIPPDKVRGQLIFVTHDTALLDDEAKVAILRRDQIYFTEKDSTGAARLFSVAEFKERNNLNLRRRYLQGRYGALPSLGTFAE